jgi:hypothetical protein
MTGSASMPGAPGQLLLAFASASAVDQYQSVPRQVPLHGHVRGDYDPTRLSGESVILAGERFPVEMFLSAHADVINYVLARQERCDDYQYLERSRVLELLVRCVSIGSGLTARDLVKLPIVHRGRWRTKIAFHLWAIGSKLAHAAKEARMAARGYKRARPELIAVNLKVLDELLRLPPGTAHEWATAHPSARRRRK